jgi:hypothetical protein
MTDPVTLARHKNTLNALMFAQNSVLITWKSKGAFSKCQILTVVFAADPDGMPSGAFLMPNTDRGICSRP